MGTTLTPARGLAGLAAGVLLTALAAACTEEPASDADTGGGGDDATVAFLMPDLASTRYEQYDAPLFTAKMEELCADCEVIYQNADGSAEEQQEQVNSAIAQGATVVVLDPVDSAAAASIVQSAQSQGVAVIAYDRPIPDKPADYYVSFDNEAIGASIAESLVEELDRTGAEGGVLQVNGSPTDAAAQLIKDGVSSQVDSSDYELLAEFDTPDWAPEEAQRWVSSQISRFGAEEIAGVVAANDGTGGGAIAAFRASDSPVPPITGNDAELAAIQRIISGDQFNTISKPIRIVAEAAAEVAYAFTQDDAPEGETELFDTPSQLFEPTVVTRQNLADEIFGPEGVLEVDDVCTDEYAAACRKLGIS